MQMQNIFALPLDSPQHTPLHWKPESYLPIVWSQD